ncbi:MAG: DUF1273 domain-containing protein [Defluviitaleaceae bacterium]|nr:DUF1273 domain-containing protein [Defluviitaleaceae bacterium]MCL2263768.1 DUF1273 domain-containing protein [Defluviitaleaceae bacterium]
MNSKKCTCCFSGHRKLSRKKTETIIKRVHDEIDNLIQKGVTDFICGGAIGFDQICADAIALKKQDGANVRLIFALPCRNQDEKWTSKQKQKYRSLLNEADEIIYVSEEYTPDCMKARNIYMVDNSAYCICTLINPFSGTGQTIRYAEKQKLHIINIA